MRLSPPGRLLARLLTARMWWWCGCCRDKVKGQLDRMLADWTKSGRRHRPTAAI